MTKIVEDAVFYEIYTTVNHVMEHYSSGFSPDSDYSELYDLLHLWLIMAFSRLPDRILIDVKQ